jgi:hypothetical protein
MKHFLILTFSFLSLVCKSQINNCDSIKRLGFGTFEAIVRYSAIIEDVYDNADKSYQKIKKRYKAYNLLECTSANSDSCLNCDCIFLLSDKYNNKDSLHYQRRKEWKSGEPIKITFVRLNHFCRPPAGSHGFDSPWLVSVVTDMEPL